VAGEIDRATRAVTARHDFELYGSGRTDAGVHAVGQIAHLDVATKLPAEMLRQRLNDDLPADINILSVEPVPHRFHARHHAIARRYVYQIARRRTAFAKPFVWWVKEPIDVARMRAAATAFTGMRDFESFTARDASRSVRPRPDRTSHGIRVQPDHDDQDAASTLVLIDSLEIVEDGDLVLVAIEGSHFLWKMVRRIVGVLVEIGRGGLEPAAAAEFLSESSAAPAKLTAPPSGLFLERVFYEGDTRDVRVQAITPLR
jgi:tRNA pseudouridine38-40 synthase